jgi:hypothetical protein
MDAAEQLELAPAPAPANDNEPGPAPGPRRRSPRLRVIAPLQLPPGWTMRSDVPANRNDCRGGVRPCPHVRCKQHLWLRLQSENPGNPKAGKQGATTLRPATMQTCALDRADRGPASFDEIGELLDMDSTRGRQIAQQALWKLLINCADEDFDTLLELLRSV